MSDVKRSRKSKMKKRNADWEAQKVEIAKELGLWPRVEHDGWSGLSAVDSGRIGGVLAARRKAEGAAAINRDQLTGSLMPTNAPPSFDAGIVDDASEQGVFGGSVDESIVEE